VNYAHLSANGATTIGPAATSGAVPNIKLHTVAINTKGAAANTLTLADASGTIAVIDTTAGPSWWLYDLDTKGQLTATLATGTAADVTITWQ
jgi:hypothetical protein